MSSKVNRVQGRDDDDDDDDVWKHVHVVADVLQESLNRGDRKDPALNGWDWSGLSIVLLWVYPDAVGGRP